MHLGLLRKRSLIIFILIYYHALWFTEKTVINNIYAYLLSRGVKCLLRPFRNNGTFVGNRYTGGYGQIWLDDVSCTGKELNINECTHRPWGWHNCEHGEDVSISCVNNTGKILNLLW